MSSTSGCVAFPFMGAYAASKHALEALSDSWRRELMRYGIDVVVIQPGAIQTPIWDKASAIYREMPASDYRPLGSAPFNLSSSRTADAYTSCF